jgi:hypothetical protein
MPSKFPTLYNTFLKSSSNSQSTAGSLGLVPVRVIDISLRDSSRGESLFQLSGEWQGLGAIKFEFLNRNSVPSEFPQGSIAYPLDINFKKLPLIGEIVFILPGPSVNYILENNSDAIEFYYINPLTVWNSNHLNLLPSVDSYSKNTNTVNSGSVVDGISNNEDNQVQEPVPGETFKEKNNIRNLWPVEGDIILEGRWGNSIRFSSTARTPSGSNYRNPWSNSGNDGDPITIIRNGQSNVDLPVNNWIPIYEDISTDDSSIYLTSTQRIDFNLASTNFASFGIDALPSTNTTQIIEDVELGSPNQSNLISDATGSISDIIEFRPNSGSTTATFGIGDGTGEGLIDIRDTPLGDIRENFISTGGDPVLINTGGRPVLNDSIVGTSGTSGTSGASTITTRIPEGGGANIIPILNEGVREVGEPTVNTQGNNVPVVNGGSSGLNIQQPPPLIEAIFLKRFDGLYRFTLKGPGLIEVTNQGTDPRDLYNRTVNEFRVKNQGKNLIIPSFDTIPIQS